MNDFCDFWGDKTARQQHIFVAMVANKTSQSSINQDLLDHTWCGLKASSGSLILPCAPAPKITKSLNSLGAVNLLLPAPAQLSVTRVRELILLRTLSGRGQIRTFPRQPNMLKSSAAVN